MNFSEALDLIKAGKKVSRSGWNGKGMFLTRAGGYNVDPKDLRENGAIQPEFLEEKGVHALEVEPHIDMWTANNKYLVGWVPSQLDLFAEDFFEVESANIIKKTAKKIIKAIKG